MLRTEHHGRVDSLDWGGRVDPAAERHSPDRRTDVGPRRELGEELLDLSLGLVGCALQENLSVLRREMRSEKGDTGEVKPAVGQQVQDDRVLTGRPRGRDPQEGLVLGEVEALEAVHEHGRRRLARVEPARIDLGDVGHEVGLGVTGGLEECHETAEELVVRE